MRDCAVLPRYVGIRMNTQAEKKVTINQVADYCGVSKTTISRFLNGKYENMSAGTREKIEATIAELNYRPDRSAQRLKSSRTMLIGCVIGDISSPFSALLLKGITSVCEEAGYQVLFADSRESVKREKRAVQGFLENRVDGLIINTCGGNDEFLLGLQARGVPTVLADRALMKQGLMDTVSSTNQDSAACATRFLFAQGYTRVAFFSETIGSISPRRLRCMGYARAVRDFAPAGIEPEIYELTGDGKVSGEECVKRFRGKYPDERIAILAANGTTAQRVLIALKALGMRAGRYLGLCTFDDWDWLQIAEPSITAVTMDSAGIGAKAASLLLERINGKRQDESPAATIELPGSLIVRDSTPGPEA